MSDIDPTIQNPVQQPPPAPSPVPDIATTMQAMMNQAAAPAAGGALNLRAYNLSQVEDSLNYTTLLDTKLEYEGELFKITEKKSQGGKWMLEVHVKVDSVFAADGSPINAPQFLGVCVRNNVMVETDNERGPWSLKALFKATGFLDQAGYFTGNSSQDMVRRRVRFQVKEGDYEGTPQNEIRGAFRSPNAASSAPGAAQQTASAGTPPINWGAPVDTQPAPAG